VLQPISACAKAQTGIDMAAVILVIGQSGEQRQKHMAIVIGFNMQWHE